MKIKEIRALSQPEMQQRLAELRAELSSLQLKSNRGPLEQPHRIGLMRRDVARILTVLHQQRGVAVPYTTIQATPGPSASTPPKIKTSPKTKTNAKAGKA